MPIYEYRCADCGKASTFVTLSVKSSFEPRCQVCGSANVKKLVSRVAVLRSEESRLESLADPARLGGLDENDPGSVARWMKKMGREMGEDLGDDFEGEIDRAVTETERGGEGGEPAGMETMGGAEAPESE
ncbi:MAG TPA: zinc ribbon domain-containing protein [Acidobacteriota bacterium]|nr:zinc ribbon domain-containing protein [Acidobacteriota bacterium]